MDRYLLSSIRQLKDQQIRFVPMDRRIEQVNRAEGLLGEIDPEKKYPYQFICYRITDYRPEGHAGVLLDGSDLRHDLRLFIEDVSGSVRLERTAVGEPVWTVEELSQNLRVTSKTITRWRDRGLVGRRFVVGGRSRVGFLKSSVDRFMSQHKEQVDRGGRFSHLSELEKDTIVKRARRMAQFGGGSASEIMRRVARRVGRSPETIRYTIRTYDRTHPTHAVFGRAVGPLGEAHKGALYQAYRRGVSVDLLARRYGKTRNTIYRVVNEMRARNLLAQKIEYIPNPLFDQPEAEAVILEPATPEGAEPDLEGVVSKPVRAPKGLPPYLASLYEIPLLKKEEEVHLFRKMNYLKCHAARRRERLDPKQARASLMDEIERLLKEALAVKNRIIRANLRLVVSIAKRHTGSANFDELVSDGNMSLIRAVEKFDFARGNKFSTYASWAIMKNFARSIPEQHTQRDRFVTGLAEMFDTTADARGSEHCYEAEVRRIRSSLAKILSRLDERERSIIISRFGLDDEGEPHTLEEVGQELGVTKERIRQIEVRALGKLRQAADAEKIELPGD